MSKPIVHTADFSRAASAISKARTNKVARYLPNPEANWGPKPRHSHARKRSENGEENGAETDAPAQAEAPAEAMAEALAESGASAPVEA